jgi:pimeloyl-ACP methyl ester carboxylesterase
MPRTRTAIARLARWIGLVLFGAAMGIWLWHQFGPRRVTVTAGAGPEELVFVRSADDVVNAGVIFNPPRGTSGPGPVAVVWVHGWGANFYSPTYVSVGRRLADRGVTGIAVNTRMHDLGTTAFYKDGRRVRGGGYWGITSDEEFDIAAWVDFAESRGFRRVVLAGHSAGWTEVARYQATRKDSRVAGLVLASGTATPQKPNRDPALMEEAARHVQNGRGDELLRLPNRSFPSFVSAATFLDLANSRPEFLDFFGIEHGTPGVREVTVPLLAFFGSRGDVGGEADLAALTAAARRHNPSLPVETAIIGGADHMYTGEEAQVAAVLAGWISRSVK